MEQPFGLDLSRRALLGRIGAGVAGTAAAVTGLEAALASPASAAAPGGNGLAGTTQYLNIGMTEFDFIASANSGGAGQIQWQYFFWGGKQAIGGTSGFVHAPINLPQGATITGFTLYMDAGNNAGDVNIRRYAYPKGVFGNGTNTGPGSDVVAHAHYDAFSTNRAWTGTLDAPASEAIDNSSYNYQVTDLLLGTGMTLFGARIAFTAPGGGSGGGFIPHNEPRFDSRTSSGGPGKLADGQERVHHVAPAGASAAVITLTATATTGGGYLAAFNADVAWPHNSSLNWFGDGQSLATTVIAPVSATGDIRIRGGGTATDYLIDVVGYF
jgi:hypothetical protein